MSAPTGPLDWPLSLTGDDYWGAEVDCGVCGDQILASSPYTLDELTAAVTEHIETCVSSTPFIQSYLIRREGVTSSELGRDTTGG